MVDVFYFRVFGFKWKPRIYIQKNSLTFYSRPSNPFGARRGIRTPDRWLKRPLLYQLSYACINKKIPTKIPSVNCSF